MSTGRLFVVVAFHAMGPAVDPKHDDLLQSWDAIDGAWGEAFAESYRMRFPDDAGNGLAFSHFFVSWSGFRTNPVQRPFGWHTVFDHYRESFGDAMTRWGDEQYWMYNHPPPSGVGNEWGLDWSHNSQFMAILNHFVLDRAYFPAAVEIPTERNDASHFIEQWFPFDFGNRNSPNIKLDSVNADGRLTSEVLDWSISPADWSHFNPDEDDYRKPSGRMRHVKFRIVDIRSTVNVLTREDLEQAFHRCERGLDTVVSAYEHDFRDRRETVMELFIEPLQALKKKHPRVELRYASARCAAQSTLGWGGESPAPRFELIRHAEGFRVRGNARPFGPTPYVCYFVPETKEYAHVPVAVIGDREWALPRFPLPARAVVGVGANDRHARTYVGRWRLDPLGEDVEEELGTDYRVQAELR